MNTNIAFFTRLLVFFLCGWLPLAAADQDKPLLTVSEAFVLQATVHSNALQLHWQIAEGYYLYRDKLGIKSNTPGLVLGQPLLPAAETYQDSFFGELPVYRQPLTVIVPILKRPEKLTQLQFTVSSQGCPPTERGCYPPERQIIKLPLAIAKTPSFSPEEVAIASVALTGTFFKHEQRHLTRWSKPTFLPVAHATTVKDDTDEPDFLDPEVAFTFSARLENPSLLIAKWEIADGYYLYRERLHFVLNIENVLGQPEFPPGKLKSDPVFGETEVYYHELEVKLPLNNTQGLQNILLDARYQGCADAGLCYPPTTKTALITLPKVAPEPTVTTPSAISAPPTNSAMEWGDLVKPGKNTTSEFLKADQAFIFSAEATAPAKITVQWQIAAGYYLYRNKFKFSITEGGTLGEPEWPTSETIQDKASGETVAVYRQPLLELTLPLHLTKNLTTVNLVVEYQGCAEAGLCYPPITKTVELPVPEASPHEDRNDSLPAPRLSEPDRIAQILAKHNLFYTLAAFFGFGLLLSLTPCVFPMIPILSSIIVGQGPQVTTQWAFIMSLVYVLSVSMTYSIVGVIAGLFGENLQAMFQAPGVIISFALIFVLLSFSMFGFYELQLPSSLQTRLALLSQRQQGGTFIGVAIMGFLSALIVGPCVAAPLAGALIYIGQTGNALLGGLALFFMSLGMGVPLLLIGLSAGHWLPKAGHWMNQVKAIFGVLLLGVAIGMLERMMPTAVTLLLWSSLFIISAVYLGALETIPVDKAGRGWRKFAKGFGLILFIYGILLLIGAANGKGHLLQPLSFTAPQTESSALPFKAIKGLEQLNQALATAKTQGKPVILDFYADWCIACKELEQFTFADPEVQKLLTQAILLRTDVTPNDQQDKSLYQHFDLFAPPVLLFFSPQGEEQRSYRVVGFVSAQAFRQHLEGFFSQL